MTFLPMDKREKHHTSHVALHQVCLDIKEEFKAAIKKHGFEQTPANPKMSDGERLKILVEEVGEVARAMTYDEGSTDELLKELLQVATMAAISIVGMRLQIQSEAFKP